MLDFEFSKRAVERINIQKKTKFRFQKWWASLTTYEQAGYRCSSETQKAYNAAQRDKSRCIAEMRRHKYIEIA